MPRIANIYSVPVGTDGVPDETVDANKYNIFIHDLELDLNAPRPISAGGTGANNAIDAMVALGGEIANQGDVRNFATYPFKTGSFFSSPGAMETPEGATTPSTNWWVGICYLPIGGLANDFYLEARWLTNNVKYVRRKSGGVWQSWVRDDQSLLDFGNALDAAKVNRAGDTMTGDLNLVYANPAIVLAGAGGGNCVLVSRKGANVAANSRWGLYLGDAAAEGGGNTGSDFSIARCADGGSVMDYPIYIKRVDGHIVTNGYVPSGANDLVNKAYVDGTGTTGLAGKVSKTGDTMTGALTVDSAITARNLANDIGIYIQGGIGSFGSLQAVNYANNAPKDLVINQFGGNVGIGTSTPGAKLDVNGSINATGTLNTGAGINLAVGNGIATGLFGDGSNIAIRTYGAGAAIYFQGAGGSPYFGDWTAARLSLGGNLVVSGSITANGVPVGGRVLLNTLTASNSATLTDTTSLTATYPTYEIVFENILPATNNDQLRLRVRSGGTFQAGAGSYVYMQYIVSTLPSNAAASGVSTFLPLSNSGAAGVGNNVSGLDGTIRLHKPTATVFKDFYGQIVHDSATQNNMITVGGSWHGSGAVIDGLEFAYVGGNIASGVIRIYGLL
jgi:hypothetical protein